MKNGLPEKCFVRNTIHAGASDLGEPPILGILRGESGYCPIYSAADPDELNASLGVSKAEAAAMLAGSMFGWDCPGADPASYDADGKAIKRKLKSICPMCGSPKQADRSCGCFDNHCQ